MTRRKKNTNGREDISAGIEKELLPKKKTGQRALKIITAIMLVAAILMVVVACVCDFANKSAEQNTNSLPQGFVYEDGANEKKSPIMYFIEMVGSFFGFGDNDNNQGGYSGPQGSNNNLSNDKNENSNNNSDLSNDSTVVRRKDEFYNFLILAKDEGGGNTDTIMVLSFDVPNKEIALLQIPRDTCMNYKGSMRKINSIYNSGYTSIKGSYEEKNEKGVEALSDALVQNFGIVIDKYVIIDLKGFRKIVDTIDGVDVYVQQDLVYYDEYQNLDINLKKGWNHLNGDKAEEFVRFRKGYVNADLGRIDAQKIFMSAFLKKLFNISTVAKAPELIGHIIEYVSTDVTLQEATYFGTRLLDMDMSQITMHTLQGTPQYYNNVSYFSTYKNANIELVNKYFNAFNKSLGSENVNPKMLIKEPNGNGYDGGKTAEEIDKKNPTLSYVH